MGFRYEASCGCNIGKIRKNNEDNFFFDKKFLEQDNTGLCEVAYVDGRLKRGTCVAIFDGMGGENFGEAAAFAAAKAMQNTKIRPIDYFIQKRKYLERLAFSLNDAVLQSMRALYTERMGTTMVALYFSSRAVYVCNIGDSRAYRLRNGEFLQLSQDHVEKRPDKKKTPLTQHLGIDPEYMLIEPYIAKGDLQKGDQYLLCSDGLTDMLTDFEISGIMTNSENVESCAQELIQAALEHGGRDNITVIVYRIV